MLLYTGTWSFTGFISGVLDMFYFFGPSLESLFLEGKGIFTNVLTAFDHPNCNCISTKKT